MVGALDSKCRSVRSRKSQPSQVVLCSRAITPPPPWASRPPPLQPRQEIASVSRIPVLLSYPILMVRPGPVVGDQVPVFFDLIMVLYRLVNCEPHVPDRHLESRKVPDKFLLALVTALAMGFFVGAPEFAPPPFGSLVYHPITSPRPLHSGHSGSGLPSLQQLQSSGSGSR